MADQPLPPSAFFRADPKFQATPDITPNGGDFSRPKARYGLPSRELAATLQVPADAAALPPLLSQTGVFRSLTDLTPNPGLIPYEVNAPALVRWGDQAALDRAARRFAD